jgi:hypothetical protein
LAALGVSRVFSSMIRDGIFFLFTLAILCIIFSAGKVNGDADPLSRIQPETKQMFHDAIKAVCSACVVSASNPCIETVLLTQNVSIVFVHFSYPLYYIFSVIIFPLADQPS